MRSTLFLIAISFALPSSGASLAVDYDSSGDDDIAVSIEGDARASDLAVSVFGDANTTAPHESGETSCGGEAVSVTGNAAGCDAASILGESEGRFTTVSLMSDASCWGDYRLCIAVAVLGETDGTRDLPGLEVCRSVTTREACDQVLA